MSEPSFYHDTRLGVLGGGQLGRMFLRACLDFNVHTAVMDPSASAPARPHANEFVQADFRDAAAVFAFGRSLHLLTIEIEDVNTEALHALQAHGVRVYPQPDILALAQDKATQKAFFVRQGIRTAAYHLVENRAHLQALVAQGKAALPCVLKRRRGGFDGRGVQVLRTPPDLQRAFDAPCVAETLVDIVHEIAVLAARNPQGQVAAYPVVQMEFNPEAHLVEFLYSPSTLPQPLQDEAIAIARRIIQELGMVGLLAVEMFVDTAGKLWVNELAPRAHNSGHHTLGAAHTSQFEQLLRAILGLPLGSPALKMPAVMVNLLGAEGHFGSPVYVGIEDALAIPGLRLHLYGKTETRPFRKMGHLTVLAPTLAEAKTNARKAQHLLRVEAR